MRRMIQIYSNGSWGAMGTTGMNHEPYSTHSIDALTGFRLCI